jgi:hypothetical protein
MSDLVAFIAGTVGVSVNRLCLGDIHLVDVPLFVLHLDRPSLGVSVPPVVVPVGACSVRVDIHRDGALFKCRGALVELYPQMLGRLGCWLVGLGCVNRFHRDEGGRLVVPLSCLNIS